MANVQKYTRTEINNGNLTRHYERAKNEKGEYYNFGNQDIDSSKTHLNYNLSPDREVGQLDFIAQRTAELNCLKRADVNVMCSWIVTAPKGLVEDEYDLFFREAYKFLNERYAKGSERNVISAYVHMDENQPHLHYAFIPVAHDFRKNIEKVSAKLLVCRSDLQTFHQDLEKHMEQVFGREIGILNETTKEGNKSIAELKRETAQEKLAEIASGVSNLQNKRDSLQDEINDLEQKSKGLERKLEGLQSKIEAVAAKEKWANSIIKQLKPISPVRVRYEAVSQWEKENNAVSAVEDHSMSRKEIDKRSGKTMLGNARTVKIDDYNILMNNHELLEANIVKREIAETKYNELVPKYNKLIKERREYKQSHDAFIRLPEDERSRILNRHAQEIAKEHNVQQTVVPKKEMAKQSSANYMDKIFKDAQQRAKQQNFVQQTQKSKQKTPTQKKNRDDERS